MTPPRLPLLAPWRDLNDAALQARLREHLPQRILVQIDPVEGSRQQANAITSGSFRFIGEHHHLGTTPDWLANPSRDIEWHILLHKFYYAVGLGEAWHQTGDARYVDTWIRLADSWMTQVPPGFIAADVTGRRLQNWVMAYRYFAGALPTDFHRRLLHSIHQQVEWLGANLHRARNHRTLELYAILLAGVALPELADAARWCEQSLRLLAENMRQDLLPDGVHCEQSTDYHHLVLRNYLNARRLCDMNGLHVPEDMDVMLTRALEFSLHAHRPDGQVPAFSDGDVHDYRDLLLQGARLLDRPDMRFVASGGAEGTPPAERMRWFPDGGYAFLRSDWNTDEPFADARYFAFDCGPLGAGNHGHLDLLSIEAYGYGHPLIVDPGRYTYHEDPTENWRVRFRGTGYHNTVQVDSLDQTRYRQGPVKYKICGPEPQRTLHCAESDEDIDYLCGEIRSHEYDACHERRIAFVRGRYWVIVDTLRAPTVHRYDLRFHLSAVAWQRAALCRRDGMVRIVSPHLLIVQPDDADTASGLDTGFVSVRYGEKSPAPVVRFTRQASDARFITVLMPFPLEAPGLHIHAEVGQDEAGTDPLQLRLHIRERGTCTEDVLTLTRQHATLDYSKAADRHGQ